MAADGPVSSGLGRKLSLRPSRTSPTHSPDAHAKAGGADANAGCANRHTADPASPIHVIAENRARRPLEDFMAIPPCSGSIESSPICLARTFEGKPRHRAYRNPDRA